MVAGQQAAGSPRQAQWGWVQSGILAVRPQAELYGACRVASVLWIWQMTGRLAFLSKPSSWLYHV